jgi:hypothetical protein
MKDKNIGRNYLERTTLLRAGVRAFVLISGELTGAEMAQVLIKALPAIVRFVKSESGPYLVKVFKDGSIERWL